MSKKVTNWKSIGLQLFWMWHDWWSDVWGFVVEYATENDCQFLHYVAMAKAEYHVAMMFAACEKMLHL